MVDTFDSHKKVSDKQFAEIKKRQQDDNENNK
jgi:hypothetical protein